MTKLFIIFLGFLLIKAVLVMLPTLIRNTMFSIIPKKKYTAEEIIACRHMKPELYYQKQLMEQEASSSKEIDVSVIRKQFKNKMQSRELTRSQIIAIRQYLENIINCKEKKFDNDCHCIYYCLKQLEKEQILDLTSLANLLR